MYNSEVTSQETIRMEASKCLYKMFDYTKGGSLYRHQHNVQVNFDCLLKMFNDGLHCDIVLVCDGRELPAHKVILASCSTYLYAKLSMYRRLKRLELKHITYETISAIVKYFYTAEVRITEENVEGLLSAAFNLAIPNLQEACWDFLQANLSSNTCVQTTIIANRFKCESLASAAFAFMAENLSQVIESEEYLKLGIDEIQDLISRDVSGTAEGLLGCLVRWVAFDPQDRKTYLLSFIDQVNLSSITFENVLQTIEQEPWLKSDAELILNIVKSHNMGRSLKLTENNEQSSKVLIVLGFDAFNWIIEIYDFQECIWKELTLPENIQIKSEDVSATIHGTTIYWIDKFMHALDLSPARLSLIDNNQKIRKRIWYGMAVLEDSVYLAGGYRNGKKLATAQRFAISDRKWSSIAKMSAGRDCIGFGALNGCLYAVGGQTSNCHCSNLAERYDPRTNSWQTLPPMSHGRRDPGVGAFGHKLFVVGGCNKYGDCKTVETFNCDLHIWSRLPDLIVARERPGVVAVDGRLFVIGGWNSDLSVLDSVEIYNAQSNSWSLMPTPMNIGKGDVTAALVGKSRLKRTMKGLSELMEG